LKSLLLLLLFIIIIVVAIVNTTAGNKIAYFYIGDQISEKARMEVKVLSLNFYDYPEFTGELLLEDEYKLDIHGVLSLSTLDLDFAVTSNCISSNICSIEDDVNVNREPAMPSQHDLIRVMRLISYILYAASVNSIISAACETIGDREIEEWAEEAFGTTDDHFDKWDGMREEADRFESLLCEWNITMICGPTLLQEWNDIELICFDY
jgi:hypothetical protein